MPSFRRHMYNKKTMLTENNTPKIQKRFRNNKWDAPFVQSRDSNWLHRMAASNEEDNEPEQLQEED